MAKGKKDQTEPTRPVGRPSTYNPKLHPLVVQLLAEQGRTDVQIAQALEINPDTLYEWYKKYPEISEAKKKGALEPDDAVEVALFHRATGYEWTEQQAVRIKVAQHEEKVEVVDVTKVVPPDPVSMIFWLKNRRPSKWRDKREDLIQDEGTPLKVQFGEIPASLTDPKVQDNLEIPE